MSLLAIVALLAAELEPARSKARELGIALRCQGFALIELGQLDAAEAMFRRCLALDPADAKARNELDYIAEQRARRPAA